MNKIKVKNSEIEQLLTVCPYCMNEVSSESSGHCGESRTHFEDGFLLTSGEIVLRSEVKIVAEHEQNERN